MYLKAFSLILCLAAPTLGVVWGPAVPEGSPGVTVPNLLRGELGDTNTTTPATSTTTTVTPETTTTTTTTTTTPAPTTTTTTTTTPAPTTITTTTTPAPTTTTTTTPAPTTTVAPNSTTTTTTPASTTTSTTTPEPVPTTTTAPPTPTTAAPPTAGEWVVKNGNISCLVAKMNFHINVSYPTTQNTTKYVVLTPLTVNSNGTAVDGKCGNTTQEIDIPVNQGSLTLEFDLKSGKSSLSAIRLNVTGLPDSIVNGSVIYSESSPLFTTPVKMSYKCSKEQTQNLTNSVDNSTAVLTFSDAQLQAFRTDNATNFSDAQDCEGADTPDMVPIAVGISLGVMIIVVLVAYLIGRRRSQSRGYVSISN